MVDWTGQNVLILGAARQGLALARYLATHGAKVILNDRRPAGEFRTAQADLTGLQLTWVFGGHPLELLDGVDLVCVSGGVPLDIPILQAATQRGLPLSNDSQVFLDSAPCPVVGITGSAGKTTTTTLVGRIALQALDPPKPTALRSPGFPSLPPPFTLTAYRQVWVGGNIGSPLIAVVDQMQAGDLAIVELSSFQLELMTRSPQVAAILNLTPNHIDRHGSMQAYVSAKARALDFQSPGDVAILGRDDPGAWNLMGRVKGGLVSFGLRTRIESPGTFLRDGQVTLVGDQAEMDLFPASLVRLRGEHNLQNVLAACAIAAAAGLPVAAMRAGVELFEGVPHRLEFVRTWRGSHWYNDSIATAPERAMAAIHSFEEPLVLLAGGRDKDLPWEDFARLVRQRVRHLILFGEAAEKIATAVSRESAHVGQPGMNYPLMRCSGLEEAVQAASQLARPGDVVLLSPGGTSFDEFRDFEERGECFKRLVMRL